VLDVCVHAVAESFADTRALLNVAVTLIERLSAQRSDTTATPVAVLTVQRALRRLGSYKRVWAALQSAQLGVAAAERPHAPMTGATPTDEQLPAGWVWQAFREADLEQLIRDLLAAKHTNAAFVIWARHHDGACRRGNLRFANANLTGRGTRWMMAPVDAAEDPRLVTNLPTLLAELPMDVPVEIYAEWIGTHVIPALAASESWFAS